MVSGCESEAADCADAAMLLWHLCYIIPLICLQSALTNGRCLTSTDAGQRATTRPAWVGIILYHHPRRWPSIVPTKAGHNC